MPFTERKKELARPVQWASVMLRGSDVLPDGTAAANVGAQAGSGGSVSPKKLLLIITADDLGIDPRRDDGIFAAHAAGAINQASLMVGGPSAHAAARRAREAGLPLGLHLDLSEMPPLAPAESIPTLLNGHGEKLGEHGWRLALAIGSVEIAEVVLEAEAQLDAFASLAGYPARHVDGHQHTHWAPGLAAALAPMFQRRGVRSIRAPHPAVAHRTDPHARQLCQACHDAARTRAIYADSGLQSTHGFVGLHLAGVTRDPGGFTNAVMAHGPGTSVELMCHVGFIGSEGDDFNRSPDREGELELLCSRPFAPWVDQGILELVSVDEAFERGGLC